MSLSCLDYDQTDNLANLGVNTESTSQSTTFLCPFRDESTKSSEVCLLLATIIPLVFGGDEVASTSTTMQAGGSRWTYGIATQKRDVEEWYAVMYQYNILYGCNFH